MAGVVVEVDRSFVQALVQRGEWQGPPRPFSRRRVITSVEDPCMKQDKFKEAAAIVANNDARYQTIRTGPATAKQQEVHCAGCKTPVRLSDRIWRGEAKTKRAVFVWFEGWAVQGACANHGLLHSLHRQNPSRNGATRRFYGVGNFGDSPPQGRARSEYVRACYI